MSLPTSRDYDAVDTGPLSHVTVNNVQDSIVAAGHGPIWVQKSIFPGVAADASISILGRWIADNASAQVKVPLDFPVGTLIEALRVQVWQPGATPIELSFAYQSGLAGDTVIDTEAGTVTSSLKVYDMAGLSTLVLSHRRYHLLWEGMATSAVLTSVEALISKP